MTTLDRQAMPIIRYRVRDLTRFLPDTCPCGRTHRRLDRIAGRTDDMFIIKGCNVYPMQIEGVLMKIPEISNHYRILLDTVNGIDQMTIEAELTPVGFSGAYGDLEKLVHRIKTSVQNEVLASPKVKLLDPSSLPRDEGKAVRVYDYRGKT